MRYAVEFACPGFEARDRALPVGVVAQDERGIHVRAIGLPARLVAAACDLPESAVAGWEDDARSRVAEPIWGSDGQPLDPRDPRWLARFAGATMEAKFFWGPVREAPGSGPATVEAIARRVREEAGL